MQEINSMPPVVLVYGIVTAKIEVRGHELEFRASCN
jgi:hypothetical protein